MKQCDIMIVHDVTFVVWLI